MAAGATFDYLGSVVLGSNTTAMTVSGIPSGYTDLFILLDANNTNSSGIGLRINGNTSNTYYLSKFYIAQSNNTGSKFMQQAGVYAYWDFAPQLVSLPNGGSYYPISIIELYDYTNTSSQKTFNSVYGNAAGGEIDTARGVLGSYTTTITSVSILNNGYQISAGSSMYVYGIAKA